MVTRAESPVNFIQERTEAPSQEEAHHNSKKRPRDTEERIVQQFQDSLNLNNTTGRTQSRVYRDILAQREAASN